MRDFTPTEVRQRTWVIDRIRAIFERYGYEPVETPTLELFETLKGKLGDEGEQLLFKVLRRGTELEDLRLGRRARVEVTDFDEVVDYALIYDLTVPFSRFLAMHPTLPLPFKRYQIQRVWRGDKPQRGRYRELYQCDVDVAGSAAMLADAEIIAITVETLRDLGFRAFTTRIGHRKLLDGLVESVGGGGHFREICIAIDKLEKIGADGVREELARRSVPAEIAGGILERVSREGSAEEILASLAAPLAATQQGPQGVAETRELLEILAAMGVPADHYALDLRLVRGLDYYTGPVFESVVTRPAIGSLTGGGRYDELIGRFTGQSMPATGTTIGLERIIDVMQELDMLPAAGGATEVLVTIFDESTRAAALGLAAELRGAGLRTEVPLKPGRGLKPQIAYASNKGIPLLAIIGPDELAAGTVTLRSGPRDQRQVARERVAAEARSFLDSLAGTPGPE
jgi:histidyl-tRNA synthetase